MPFVSGVYRYEDGVLTLVEHSDEETSYKATVIGTEMELERLWEGQKVKAEFERKE
jgi:hypothetical protein